MFDLFKDFQFVLSKALSFGWERSLAEMIAVLLSFVFCCYASE